MKLKRSILIPFIRGLFPHQVALGSWLGEKPQEYGVVFFLPLGKSSRIGITVITGIFDTIGETF